MFSKPASRAARSVWDRADRYTRDTLGFSILTVVRDNPPTLLVGRERLHHPDGVLFRTRFTQVAMAVLAAAQTEMLREACVLVPDAVTAGHSVGEYNALAAIGQVLPVEAVVDIVWHRGTAMESLVDRDERGETGFRMGAVRPSAVGLTEAELIERVATIRARTGRFLQVVNYNVRDRQYAITGHTDALQALFADLDERVAPGGRKAWVQVPGIDIPFHSSLLRQGVEAFRTTLDAAFPDPVPWRSLVGRYVPNLVARPFSLERDFAQCKYD